MNIYLIFSPILMPKYPSLSPLLVPPSSSSWKFFSSSSLLLTISLINFYPFYTAHLSLSSQTFLPHLSLSSAVAQLCSPLHCLFFGPNLGYRLFTRSFKNLHRVIRYL